MEDCVFCRMAQGEIVGLRVYEDADTLAIMDIAMDVDGHILVVPKRHVISILDCDAALWGKVASTVKKVSNHLTEHCGYEGVDLLSANGEAAGQSLPHFHVHIIPRKFKDGLGEKGEWPCFPGAKEPLVEAYQRLRFPDAEHTEDRQEL